jgi:hypothetical protein
MNRTKCIIELRPVINTALIKEKTSTEESFQNNTLRPIIKFQHEIIMIIVEHSINKYSKDFSSLSIEKKMLKVESIFKTNSQLKNELRGIITGLFSKEEYELYNTIRNEVNKRIIQIIKERFLSTL